MSPPALTFVLTFMAESPFRLVVDVKRRENTRSNDALLKRKLKLSWCLQLTAGFDAGPYLHG
jgi:hypothetical protein